MSDSWQKSIPLINRVLNKQKTKNELWGTKTSVLRPVNLSWVLWDRDSLWLPRPYKRTAARTWSRPPPQRWLSPGLVRQTFRGQFSEILNLSPQLNTLGCNFYRSTGRNRSKCLLLCDHVWQVWAWGEWTTRRVSVRKNAGRWASHWHLCWPLNSELLSEHTEASVGMYACRTSHG